MTFFTFIRISIAVLLALFSFSATQAKPSSTNVLPKGVGLFKFSQRMSAITEAYDDNGKLIPSGDAIRTDLNAGNVSKIDAKLADLITELNAYGTMENGMRLGDSLLLGTITADAKADIQASILQAGYGLTSKITLFGALTYVSADVKSKLRLENNNNSLGIAEKLGDLAYDQVKEGLEIASRVSIQDVEAAITTNRYKPINDWQHQGLGDTYLGAMYGEAWSVGRSWVYDLGLTGTVILPTGYVEHPDYLQDISTSNGHVQTGFGVNQVLRRDGLNFNLNTAYTLGFTNSREMRVPQQTEPLIDKSRTTQVDVTPGAEWSAEVGASFKFLKMLGLSYRLGTLHSGADSYSGSMSGNYKELAKNSESMRNYHETEIAFDTVSLFKRKKFAIPLIAAVTYHQVFDALNADDMDYWQFSLTGFVR